MLKDVVFGSQQPKPRFNTILYPMFNLFKEKPHSHDFKLAILVISGALLEDCKLPEWDL